MKSDPVRNLQFNNIIAFLDNADRFGYNIDVRPVRTERIGTNDKDQDLRQYRTISVRVLARDFCACFD